MKAHKNTMTDDTRLALLEQSIGHINETLMRFEKRFDKLDERLDSIENKMWTHFTFLFFMITGVLGILAHAQHWI